MEEKTRYLTGNKPASAIPRKALAITRPWKFVTNPVIITVIPHPNIITGNHIDCNDQLTDRLLVAVAT